MDIVTLALAKKYTDTSLVGGGAIKGKNCVIDSIAAITGGNRVTFKWTLDDGTVQTGTMDVMDGEDGQTGATGAQGPTGPAGKDGKNGKDGTDGIDGQDGADGLGIKSVAVNSSNHLIITYDDDTTEDAGAIEGMTWTDVTGTLEAGSTSITLTSEAITTSSTIDVYNNLDVPYDSKTLSTGSITLTFDEQESDMMVKVRVS